MKRIFAYIILIMCVCYANAQTQQGIVRTAGTMAKHGSPLSSATVKVRGNANSVVSNDNGAFLIPMSGMKEGQPFHLSNVIKLGYQLLDKDATTRPYAYSSKTSFEVVMISYAEMKKTQKKVEEMAYTRVVQSYQAKVDALEKEYKANAIKQEEYNKRSQMLMEQFDVFESIITDMAEHYARLDFDRLDSLDAQISACILRGKLDKADILIAQKGSLDERIKAYQRHAANNAMARAKLDELETELAKRRQQYIAEREDISNDLYNKHSIAISRFDFDKALEYMKLRADLDTTNLIAAEEYAHLAYKQKRFDESKAYYEICLSGYEALDDGSTYAGVCENMGNLYSDISDFESSEKYYKQALAIIDRANGDPTALQERQASLHNNLGLLYTTTKDYQQSRLHLEEALALYDALYKDNPDVQHMDCLAMVQENLGNLYNVIHDYANEEKFYLLAYKNIETLYAKQPDSYLEILAKIQNNIAGLYDDIRNYDKAEEYHKLALQNKETLHKRNPDAYKLSLAISQQNIGSHYEKAKNYRESERYYKLAEENLNILMGMYPDAYLADLLKLQTNLCMLYYSTGNSANFNKYADLSLKSAETLYSKYPEVYRTEYAMAINNLGAVYMQKKDYKTCEPLFKKALPLLEQAYEKQPEANMEQMALLYKNFVQMYYEQMNKYSTRVVISVSTPGKAKEEDTPEEAGFKEYCPKAIALYEKLCQTNPTAHKQIFFTLHKIHTDYYKKKASQTDATVEAHIKYVNALMNTGIAYEKLSDYPNAESKYNEGINYLKPLCEKGIDSYLLYMGMFQHNMGLMYRNSNKSKQAEEHILMALENKQMLFEKSPDRYSQSLYLTLDLISRFYRELKQEDKAINFTNRLIDLIEYMKSKYPNDYVNRMSWAYNRMAYLYLEKENYKQALAMIEKAIKTAPDDPNFYDSKGEILLRQGKEKDALKQWKKVMELNPDFQKDYPDGTELSKGLKARGLIN